MRAVLLALNACDGMPMPEQSLISAAQIMVRPTEATASDVKEAVRELESQSLVCGVSDPITGVSWSLTDKGTHRARQLH